MLSDRRNRMEMKESSGRKHGPSLKEFNVGPDRWHIGNPTTWRLVNKFIAFHRTWRLTKWTLHESDISRHLYSFRSHSNVFMLKNVEALFYPFLPPPTSERGLLCLKLSRPRPLVLLLTAVLGWRWYGPLVNWLWQGKPEVFGEKPIPPQFCPSQISTKTGPGSNPGLGDATPVTNCLRHGKDVWCSPISEEALIISKVPRLGPFVFLITAACRRRWVWSFGGMILTGETRNKNINLIYI